jgi:hypothetical protein
MAIGLGKEGRAEAVASSASATCGRRSSTQAASRGSIAGGG